MKVGQEDHECSEGEPDTDDDAVAKSLTEKLGELALAGGDGRHLEGSGGIGLGVRPSQGPMLWTSGTEGLAEKCRTGLSEKTRVKREPCTDSRGDRNTFPAPARRPGWR